MLAFWILVGTVSANEEVDLVVFLNRSLPTVLKQDGTPYAEENVLDELGEMVEFDFSPDGRYIAISRRTGDGGGYPHIDLFIYDRLTQIETSIVLDDSSNTDWHRG